ncbi:uncharacterized protein LOC144443849 [Glandiceps talaboti]
MRNTNSDMVGSAVCVLSTLSTALFLTGFIFAYVSDQHALYVVCLLLTLASGIFTVATYILCIRQRRVPIPVDEEELECLDENSVQDEYEDRVTMETPAHLQNETENGDFDCFDEDVDITDSGNHLVDIDLNDSTRQSAKQIKYTRI